MLTYSEYEDYFRNLATSFSLIGHTEAASRFATMDIDSILSNQRGALDFTHPTMILENPEGAMEWKHDRMKDENLGAFHILQHVSRNNPEQKRAVMDLAKAIGTKIIAKMQTEKIARMKGDNTQKRFLLYFDLSQVRYQKVGPVFSDCYGWRFEFNIAQETPLSLIHDPSEWL